MTLIKNDIIVNESKISFALISAPFDINSLTIAFEFFFAAI